MRIVIDCRCVFPGCGGIGNYARNLVKAMAAVNDYDAFIVLRTASKRCDAITDAPNFREIAVPAAMLDADWEQLQLPVLLASLQADLYHNTTFALPVVAPCCTVTTIHDVVFHYRPELVEPSLCAYLSKWAQVAAQVAERIITVSQYSRKAIMDAYDVAAGKIDVTYEAAALRRFRPRYWGAVEDEFRANYGIVGPFVLYVGSLEPKKNIDNLLAAFAEAKEEIGVLQLVLAGSDTNPQYQVREAVRAFHVDSDTVITGFLPDRYLPVAYSAAGTFAYPSLYEGFGLPPLEAMACGTATVVSNVTSLPEVVGDAALLVDPLDVGEMAHALCRLARDEGLRSELAIQGADGARRFTWQATALNTLATYRLAAS